MAQSRLSGGTLNEGDLVKTSSGYYGIVSCLRRRGVFLGNGLEEFLTVDEFLKLEQCPLNIYATESPGVSNFLGLARSLFAGK